MKRSSRQGESEPGPKFCEGKPQKRRPPIRFALQSVLFQKQGHGCHLFYRWARSQSETGWWFALNLPLNWGGLDSGKIMGRSNKTQLSMGEHWSPPHTQKYTGFVHGYSHVLLGKDVLSAAAHVSWHAGHEANADRAEVLGSFSIPGDTSRR